MIRGPLDALGAQYIPFEGPLDVSYFLDQPSADVARRALEFLSDRGNEIEVHRRNGTAELERMWRGTLRSCLGHGVPLSDDQRLYAAALGVAP